MTLRAEAELVAAATVVADAALEGVVRRFAPRAALVVVPDERPATSVLLAAVARADGNVVRLYAGDPWLHPAHGAELTALDRAGIASEPVAGVATEVALPGLAGVAVHVRHLAITCTIGPTEAMPSVLDPARTLVVLTDDVGTAAIRLGTGGDPHIPAAVVPLDRPAVTVRGILAEIGSAAPAGRCLLVVGAVAGPDGHSDPDRAACPPGPEDEASSWRAPPGGAGCPWSDEPGGSGREGSEDQRSGAGTGDRGRRGYGSATSDRPAGGGW